MKKNITKISIHLFYLIILLSNREKIEELKFLQKQRQRTHGIDIYSLAIGESSESTIISKSNIDVINYVDNLFLSFKSNIYFPI